MRLENRETRWKKGSVDLRGAARSPVIIESGLIQFPCQKCAPTMYMYMYMYMFIKPMYV